MPTLSSAGIGSGLDVKSIVAQLMAVERKPLLALQQTQQKTQGQLTAYGKLQAAMEALRSAAARLSTAQTWSATTVTSSNTSAVVATSDGTAPVGSYSVSVAQLAAAQTVVSGTTWSDSKQAVGAGSLTIELGSWDAGQTTFTPKSGATPVTLTFAAGQDTLENVRDAINAAGAGVNASIVNDASGARLSLRSTTPGAVNGFRLSVADDDGNNTDGSGLSQLAFDPSAGVTSMAQTLAAANASATINGVTVSSTTNALDNVLDGLNIGVLQKTTGNVDVTVNRDSASIRKAITDFASAYNDLVKLVREQTATRQNGKGGGILEGDASAVGLLNQMRSLIGGSSGATGTFSRLADVGLEPQRDGTLKVIDSKLDGALAKLSDLRDFFSRDDANDSLDGFGTLLKTFADLRTGQDGLLTTRQQALQASITRLTDRQSQMQDRLDAVEKRLNEQYTRLDNNMAQLTSLQNYVTQQLAAWNKSK